MNYKESKEILDSVKAANNILIGCHKSPDDDTVGGATAIYGALTKMGKVAKLVCSEDIPPYLAYIPETKNFKKIDFQSFDFSKYDLFITVDSSELKLVTAVPEIESLDINIIVIDHHKTNSGYGNINLIKKISSTSEIIYKLFEDWEVKFDKNIASSLLAGIIGDTGSFKYRGVTKETFTIASKLVDFGADRDEIISQIYFNLDIDLVRAVGKIIGAIKVDKEGEFAWSAVPFESVKECDNIGEAKSFAASLFIGAVKGAKFGIVIIEKEKGIIGISLRSRKGFDVSELAVQLGGGGHPSAAAAIIEGSFNNTVEKILTTARDYVKKKK